MGKEATPTLHVRENGRIPKRRQFRHHGLGCYSAAEPFGGTFDLRPVDQQIFVVRSGTLLVVGVPVSAVSGILQNEQGMAQSAMIS